MVQLYVTPLMTSVWLYTRHKRLGETYNPGPIHSHVKGTPLPDSYNFLHTHTSPSDAELRAAELAVMVPQHEMEVLPRQLLLILEARLPEHGIHHLCQLSLG